MENINDLTAKTILEDDVFCEVLDQDDEVHKARLLLTLIDRATELGVKKKFETLFNAFKKEKKKFDKENENKKPITNQNEQGRMTEFNSTKYDELYCGSWIADGNGVRTFSTFGGEILACYHPILPVQRLINAHTGMEKIKIAYKKGKKWRDIIVEKGVIASSNRITNLSNFGISVTSENARGLVRYLSDMENFNMDKIEERVSTSKLGWVNGEFMPYGNDVVIDSTERFKEIYESICEHGDYDIWLELAKNIRKSDRFEPKIYMIASLASALIEPLNALPFLLNLWGSTGRGKTVAIMLATSIWANPDGNKYATDPKSTPTALELRLDFLNNFPMMVDDMAQLKAKYQGDFSELIYFLCSGKGKDRANQSLGINNSTTWKNVILTNGEHSLVTETMQGGAINRIIDVEMEDGYIFPDGNEVVDIIKKNYGHAGTRFVDAIKEIGIPQIKEIQRDFLQKINDRAKEQEVEKEEKQSLPMSILLAADQIATDYIFQDGEYLDFETCVNILKNKGEISESERAYEFIMSEVSVHINNFKPNLQGEYKSEVWGHIEGGYVYIATNIFNKMCKEGNFSSKSFLSWAKNQELIQHDKGRLAKRKRIGKTNVNYYCIKLLGYEVDSDGFESIPENEQEELPFT